MLVFVLDRYFNRLTTFDMLEDNPEKMSFDTEQQSYQIIDNVMLSTFTARVPKKFEEAKHLNLGNYIAFKDEWGKLWCFTITEISNEDRDYREIYCEDVGLDLLNSTSISFQSNEEQTIDYYLNRELYDTGWSIGINEIKSKKKVTFEESSTTLRRIQDIAKAFECEVYFDIEFNGRDFSKQQVNIVKQIGLNRSRIRLTNGREITTLTKSINIKELKTACYCLGANGKDISSLDYDDGTYYSEKGSSLLINRDAHERWNRFANKNSSSRGYFEMVSNSNSEDVNTILHEGKKLLEQASEPQASYNASMNFELGLELSLGDYVEIADPDFNPALFLKARINELVISRLNSSNNQITLSNFSLLEDGISDRIKTLEEKQGYITQQQSNNISIKIHQRIEEQKMILEAQVLRGLVDITNEFSENDFSWMKQTLEGPDEKFNNEHYGVGNKIEIDINLVDRTDIFTCQLLVHPFQFVSQSWFQDELKSVAQKIEYEKEDNSVVVILANNIKYSISSRLNKNTNILRQSKEHIKNIVELTNMTKVDLVVLNGNIIDGSTTKDKSLESMQQIIDLIKLSNCNYGITFGNTDTNIDYALETNNFNNMIKQHELNKILKKSVGNQVNVRITDFNSTYIDVNNVRHIMLNTSDLPFKTNEEGHIVYNYNKAYGYTGEQIQWLADVLKSTPKNFDVCIYQHLSFGKTYSNQYELYNFDIVTNLITAFKNKGIFDYHGGEDIFKADIEVDFTTNKSKVLFCDFGHFYEDIFIDYNQMPFICTANNVAISTEQIQDRNLHTKNEDLFDVLVYKPIKKEIKLIRFGAGKDRTIDLTKLNDNLLGNVEPVPSIKKWPDEIRATDVNGWQRFDNIDGQEILFADLPDVTVNMNDLIEQSIHVRTNGIVESAIMSFYSGDWGHRHEEVKIEKINDNEYKLSATQRMIDFTNWLRPLSIVELKIKNYSYVEFRYPRLVRLERND